MQKFSVSLMDADLMNAQAQIRALSRYADAFHVDILDWHYAKNLCLSPQFIRQMRPNTDLPIEVHLMVEGVELELARACLEAGADVICFDADNIRKNVFTCIDLVQSAGKRFGVVLNPATGLECIEHYADRLDFLLFMGVTPGFGGQKLIPAVLDKIRAAHRLRQELGCHFETEIDGGCHLEAMKAICQTGVDYIVLGKTCLFSHSPDMDVAWQAMRADFDAAVR